MSRATPADSRATGCLYLVGTPIGNLEDITLRALRILKEVDAIACEDTRQTQKLLSRYQIKKRLISYHEHNEMTRAAELVIEIEQGVQLALVSDAGMPAISDPGQHLVALCRRHGIPVIPVPGASALTAALAASGISTESFVFLGFLPSRASERRRTLARLATELRTMIFYEAPHRLVETLADVKELLGNRHAVIAREVTKLHEEFLRGTVEELLGLFKKKDPRGEITLLISGENHPAAAIPAKSADLSIARRVEEIASAQGLDRKAALKQAARERGLSRREAYKQLLLNRSVNPS